MPMLLSQNLNSSIRRAKTNIHGASMSLVAFDDGGGRGGANNRDGSGCCSQLVVAHVVTMCLLPVKDSRMLQCCLLAGILA